MTLSRYAVARIARIAAVAIPLSGCVSPTVDLTLSDPKVYGEDEVVRMFSERYRGVDAISGPITESEAQQSFGVREGRRYDADVDLRPMVPGGTPQAPPSGASSDLKLPDAASTAGLGLTYSDQLRRKMRNAQEAFEYRLLFAGDTTFRNSKLMLLRFELSINDYIEVTKWWEFERSHPEFIQVDFNVCGPQGTDVNVYWLGPEYDSLISKESLVTTMLEDFSLAGTGASGGVNISGAGRMQHQLDEAFATFAEVPLQFAVYGGDGPKVVPAGAAASAATQCAVGEYLSHFAFALGPKRELTKRSVLNPLRYLSTTYRIDYSIYPGVRDVYALLAVKQDFDNLSITSSYNQKLVRTYLASSSAGTGAKPRSATALRTLSLPTPQRTMETREVCTVSTDSVFPKVASSIMIETQQPVTPETRVFVGPTQIPRERLSIDGRHRIVATIGPDKALEEILKKEKTATLMVSTPGALPCEVPMNLRESGADPSKRDFVLDPSLGNAGTEITITSQTGKDFTKVTSARTAYASDVTIIEKKKDSLKLSMPAPPAPNAKPTVSLMLVFGDKTETIANAFTYQ